jgi:DNA-binding NtrC family response regulator
LHRLRVIYLPVPSLRERKEDIAKLSMFFISTINQEEFDRIHGYPKKQITKNALNFLMSLEWPGNVRELENTLKAACAWNLEKTVLDTDDFKALVRSDKTERRAENEVADHALSNEFNLEKLLDEVRRHHIEKAWKVAKGKKTEAARLLGMKKAQNIDHWQKKYNLQ